METILLNFFSVLASFLQPVFIFFNSIYAIYFGPIHIFLTQSPSCQWIVHKCKQCFLYLYNYYETLDSQEKEEIWFTLQCGIALEIIYQIICI